MSPLIDIHNLPESIDFEYDFIEDNNDFILRETVNVFCFRNFTSQ